MSTSESNLFPLVGLQAVANAHNEWVAVSFHIPPQSQGALLAADGTAAKNLFTLGPSRRPAYFESTAIPELRQQAADLAAEIAHRI